MVVVKALHILLVLTRHRKGLNAFVRISLFNVSPIILIIATTFIWRSKQGILARLTLPDFIEGSSRSHTLLTIRCLRRHHSSFKSVAQSTDKNISAVFYPENVARLLPIFFVE